MDGSNIQHYFEKLDRSLKRLGIVLVDDFEEVKKGVPAPIVALVRKLLFNTSTIVMKYMLLRGCPSHVSDKKVVISLFDLLRETVKYSPPISIDQFFNTVSRFARRALCGRPVTVAAVSSGLRTTQSGDSDEVGRVCRAHRSHGRP